MKILLLFIAWFTAHFNLSCIFTPLALVNNVPVYDKSKARARGVTDVFVFGLRVMRVHRTYPWK